MRALEALLLWSTVGLYFVDFFIMLYAVVFGRRSLVRPGWLAAVAAFLFHSATIANRWIESGHPPVLWRFEHALAGSWLVAAIYLAVGRAAPQLRVLGVTVTPFVILMLGYGIMGGPASVEPLPPPYQSNWLWVHVFFAWAAYGAFVVAAAVGVYYLVKARGAGRDEVRLASLDELCFRVVIFGFVSLTVEIGAGAIWAYGLWGRYWGWDPIETWSLVTWVVYGLNIHLRASYGWKGSRAAWLAIASLAAVLVTFGGIGFIGGVHTPLL
ncbi:MAG TPA: cytochrome C biogenesis protein [Deltaproteobacteria bacterium]|nr:cytochrome C biogenesis protein [Deltaproteobacteria bacterium]